MADQNERVISEFKMWYPTFYERAEFITTVGYHLVLAALDDGTKVEFCSLDNTLRDVTRTYDTDFNDNMDDEEYRKEFSIRLKTLLHDRGIKQEDLADTIGVSRQIMSRYINGKSMPKVYIIRRMSRVLDCDIRDLIDFDYILRQ